MDEQTKAALREAFRQGSLQVEGVTATGVVGWFPVRDVLRHEVPHKRALRVTLENGTSVTSTEDHSLFVGLSPVRADDLRPGMPLTVVVQGRLQSVPVTVVVDTPHDGVMYDLCVPGPENFVLSNGILAHNSYSIGGVSLDIDKSSKYESAASSIGDQFDKMLEKAKQTVKIAKGLQQPRYGIGIRSSFGPYTGRGVLTPAKFLGFIIPFVLSLHWVPDLLGALA